MSGHSPLPPAFINRMQDSLGLDSMSDFIESIESIPPVSIRLHPFKSSQYKKDSNSFDPIPWCKSGYYLKQRPIFTLDPGFHSGGYYVQEASSMLIEYAMQLALKEFIEPKILDLCAAPGGKSTLILSLLNQHGLLVSNETIQSRVAPLSHNLIKWGYLNQVITNGDPERFALLSNFFDIVLIDAPCSGEGLFRKDISSRNEWSESNTNQCALRQRRILKHAIEALNPGGYLIYSTCTYNPSENIDQVCYLNSLGLQSIKMQELISFGLEMQEKENGIGYQAYPHKVKGEGFFISLLQKTSDSINQRISSSSIEWSETPNVMEQYLSIDGLSCFKHQDSFHVFPEKLQRELEEIRSRIKIVHAGLECGSYKHNDFIPHHALSQYYQLIPEVPAIEIADKSALDYLKGNALLNEKNEIGYHLAMNQSQKMGWVKAIRGRLNNLYPHAYRIKGNFNS